MSIDQNGIHRPWPQEITDLLEYVARDSNDVAIGLDGACNFCYGSAYDEEAATNDDNPYGLATRHAPGCLYIAARRLLGFPIE